jgi:hypothetical protein
LLLDDDTGAGPGTAECWVDEQAATRTQLLAPIAIARIRPISHMIDATEPALHLRSQFVAQPLHRRDGISDCRAPIGSLPPQREGSALLVVDTEEDMLLVRMGFWRDRSR